MITTPPTYPPSEHTDSDNRPPYTAVRMIQRID